MYISSDAVYSFRAEKGARLDTALFKISAFFAILAMPDSFGVPLILIY
jgi:acid phosphatase family membrane protein YuiD